MCGSAMHTRERHWMLVEGHHVFRCSCGEAELVRCLGEVGEGVLSDELVVLAVAREQRKFLNPGGRGNQG